MPAAEAVGLETTLARDAALLTAVREAGALALSMFGTDSKTGPRATLSPVSEADIAVDDLLRERLHGARPDYGWLSEESADDPARLDARARSGSSIRSTAPAPISPARRTGRSRRRWSRTAGRSSPVSTRRPREEFFVARAGGGATRNGARDRGERRSGARRTRASPGRESSSSGSRRRAAVCRHAADAVAGAAACPRRARRLRRRDCRRQQPRLGPCGG